VDLHIIIVQNLSAITLQRKSKKRNTHARKQQENRKKNTNGKHTECDHVTKKCEKKQQSRILQENEYKISYP
jgi:hypothetical protein